MVVKHEIFLIFLSIAMFITLGFHCREILGNFSMNMQEDMQEYVLVSWQPCFQNYTFKCTIKGNDIL